MQVVPTKTSQLAGSRRVMLQTPVSTHGALTIRTHPLSKQMQPRWSLRCNSTTDRENLSSVETVCAQGVENDEKRKATAWAPRCPAGGTLRRLLPPVVQYSSDRCLLTPEAVAELWEQTLERPPATPLQLQRAIQHSFAVQVAYVVDPPPLGSPPHSLGATRLVGLARATSDGAFVATICDVAVMPKFQARGIGTKLIRNLVSDMRSRGPSSFAVFPRPEDRDFFVKCGFRLSHRFIMMRYQGGSATITRAPNETSGLHGHKLGIVLAQDGKTVFDESHSTLDLDDAVRERVEAVVDSAEQGVDAVGTTA